MKIKNVDIFTPLVIVIVILFFLLLATIGIQYHMRHLKPVAPIAYLYIFYGILVFLAGFYAAKLLEKYFLKKRNNSTGFKTFFDYIENSRYFKEKFVLIFVLSPILIQLINLFFLGGIPLFSGVLKAKAFNILTIISYISFLISINVLIAKFYKKKYFLLVFIGVILFAATGYRATTIAIIVSVLITAFYTNEHKFKHFLIITPVIIVLGLIVGYIAALSIEWQHWNVNPLSLVFIRAGFTLTVLNKIIQIQNTGHGLITQSILSGFLHLNDPRLVLGQFVFKSPVSYTSTIFGPSILDFGYIGLTIQMFFLGMMLELLHYLQQIKKGTYTAFYAMGLAHTMIWVETGPTDLAVWIYFLIAVVLVLTATTSMNKNPNNIIKHYDPKDVKINKRNI
jgi:oligosaccharide repeat unit polymerase